jgi:hypothetical protein
VKPLEIRYVDLKKLIPGRYRNDRDWGGMKLAYTGGTREMWAQLRMLSVNGGGSVDVFSPSRKSHDQICKKPSGGRRHKAWPSLPSAT